MGENMKLKEENSHFKQIVSDVIKSLPENGPIQSTSDGNKQPQEDFEQEAEIMSEETNDEKRDEIEHVTADSSEGTNDLKTKINQEVEPSVPAESPSTNNDEASEEHMQGE